MGRFLAGAVNGRPIGWENAANPSTIAFMIDGGGSAISTGEAGHIPIDFDGEIIEVEMFADQSGSITVDIWKDTYANFPPTDADSICGVNEPSISGATKMTDSTLTDWTTTVNAGDVLAFNVDSCATIERCTVKLTLNRT